MADLKSFPNNVDEYSGAADVMKWHYGRGKGVYGANSSSNTNLVVRALTIPAMGVTVSDGIAWMTDDAMGSIVTWNDYYDTEGNLLQLTVETADATYPRIDRVVITWNLPNYNTKPVISVLKGTAQASPTAPALTNNSSKRQISLAKIAVAAGATTITASNITDERLDSTVCGICTDSVQIDTSGISSQWSSLVADLEEQLATVIAGGLPHHSSTHSASGADPITVGSTTGMLVETTTGGALSASRKIVVGNTTPASVTGLSEGDIYIYCPDL